MLGGVAADSLDGQPCVLADTASDPRYDASVDGRYARGVPSYTLPLLAAVGRRGVGSRRRVGRFLSKVDPQPALSERSTLRAPARN